MALLSVSQVSPAIAVEHWARQVAAWSLVEELAVALAMPSHMVRQSLASVPGNMAFLFDSPEGWTALAAYVAHDLGVRAPDYLPAVH